MVEHYFGSQVYAELTEEQLKTKTHVKEMMQVTVGRFGKRVNELPKKVTDKERVQNKVWTSAASYCVMRYINDAGYLLGAFSIYIDNLNKPRKNDEHVMRSSSPSFFRSFSSRNMFNVQALCNTPLGVEL